MRQTLVIDNGNSSTKIGVERDGEILAVRSYRRLTAQIAGALLKEYGDFDAVASCSVGADISPALDVLRQNVSKVLCVEGTTPVPVSLDGYKRPERLGPDRIAALCGAYAEMPGKEILVADYGTAITYDLLLSNGTFAGGNIAPGTGMRMRALHEHTARLPLINLDQPPMLWGDDTDQAILAGVLHGVAGELCHYRRLISPDAEIIVTGGASARVLPLLPFTVNHRPNLVLTGLKSILDYNENN